MSKDNKPQKNSVSLFSGSSIDTIDVKVIQYNITSLHYNSWFNITQTLN